MPWSLPVTETSRKPSIFSRVNWEHPMNCGMVACWLMSENAGSLARSKITKIDGNIVGGTWTTTMYGSGVYLSGVSHDYIDLSSENYDAVKITGDMTIACLFTFDTSNIGVILDVLNGSYQGFRYCIEYPSDGAQGFYSNDGNGWRNSGTATPKINGFASIGLVLGSTTGQFYANGSLDGAAFTNGARSYGAGTTALIGKRNDAPNDCTQTFIYEFVWNRALSQQEMRYQHLHPYGTPDNPRFI